MKRLLVIVAILAAGAACGGSSTAATTSGPVDRSSGGVQSSSGALVPSKVGGQPAAVPNTAAPATDANPALPAIQGPQVIRQAQLAISVSSSSFDSKLTALRAIVEQEQGYIAGTDAQANPLLPNDQIRSGVITFMVPAANFDPTIDLVTKLGKVQNEHISGSDVSAQYVDLQARLANEEAQRNAMLALLGRAQSVSDIIAVQNQLGQITQLIEELKGQISYIDHNTAFSTITVQISEAGMPAPTTATSTDSWGLVSALTDAAHNFVTTINYLITGLGAIGPVVVLLGAGYLVWRRRRMAPQPGRG